MKLMNGDFDCLLTEGTVSEGDVEFILVLVTIYLQSICLLPRKLLTTP
jgi:hypothetical protein